MSIKQTLLDLDALQKLGSFLERYAFYIDLNANDMFYTGADCTTIDVHDLPKLVEVERMFGLSGVAAFQAKVRQEEPLESWVNDKYLAAKDYLSDWVCFSDSLATSS